MRAYRTNRTVPAQTSNEACRERISDDIRLRKISFLARTAKYLRFGYDRTAAADFVAAAAERLTGPALDVGTGKGLMAMALARRGLEVISVDVDAEEQALAVRLAVEAGLKNRIRFIRADASCLSSRDGRFGCAAMMDVLHHLKDPRDVLEETARVVKPSGILILADFSRDGFELVARVHREEGSEHPVSGATLDAAAEFLSERGFEDRARLSGFQHDVIVLKKKG